MKLLLIQEILIEIVSDGVKEMLKRLNFSRRSRRCRWFKEFSQVLDHYKKEIGENLIPVIIEDFKGSIAVKISNNKMDKKEIQEMKKFMEMVKMGDTSQYVRNLKNGAAMAMAGRENWTEEDNKKIMNIINDGHEWILNRIDLYIRSEVFRQLQKLSEERSKLETTIYNFTDEEMPEEIRELFKNGVDVVPRVKLSILEVKKRVNEALKEYLERVHWKTNKSRKFEANDVIEWLKKAIAFENDEEDLKFYQNLINEYDGFMKEIENNHNYSYNEPKEKEIRKLLEIKNCVIVACDKNLGMSLFTLDTMRKADEKLMNQLGAKYVKGTEEEILKVVLSEIDNLEDGFCQKQKNYMDYAYKSRDIGKCDIIFPFLKSTHKVQKMTTQEIREKNISNLKFRPIIDARRWATRGYAGLIMGMLRKANDELISRAGPVLKEIKVKNGWRFSRVMQDFNFEEDFGVMVSADIGEAYTNITSRMINESIEIVFGFIGYQEWKIKLIRKMVDFVLT